ncbi:glycosyltransferase [Flavihumibacter stibioxidans]|uniref:Glycosyltransferase 2-like domain-containing protein n=1 Tax=Flavihumibacter stibioxidans TaxID=1834163 RepID=A0ABR7MBT2_9BACT|nr:glycosyltransferase [Flavihumibacter stibioxidans]MBC6491964.1 hypothetical protein [Flavihumibacter stibioxidans]
MIFVYTITFLLLIGYAFLLQFYHRSWKQQPEDSPPPSGYTPVTAISVLVPARNEEGNIGHCIASLLAQDYPQQLLDIIIIDDHSEDGTSSIVKEFEQQGVRLLSLRDWITAGQLNSYKKKAIEAGISLAKGTLIVTTDADCSAGPDWLKIIAHCHETKNAQLVAGPVKMRLQRGWLSVFQSLDFLSLQGITAASVFRGFHSMCNGANLAYTVAAFRAVDGFKDIDGPASGDDMLLMHKISGRFPGQIAYLKNRAAIVDTEPAGDLRTFLQQRIRWASKARFYEDKQVFRVLLLVYVMNLGLLITLTAAFFSGFHAAVAVGFILLKTLFEWPFMKSVASFFNQSGIMKYFLFFQPVHIIYTITAGSFGQFGRYEWKGRMVR